jgi:hypothetical protein
MKIFHGSLRHREQSEATQTKGLQLRLSLGCFAVARNDGRALGIKYVPQASTYRFRRWLD